MGQDAECLRKTQLSDVRHSGRYLPSSHQPLTARWAPVYCRLVEQFVYLHTCTCIHVHICVCTHMCMYIPHVYVHIHLCACMYIYTQPGTYTYTYIYIYIYIYIYALTYVHMCPKIHYGHINKDTAYLSYMYCTILSTRHSL